ncbi:MAG: Flp pilus assembly complex ATPase component TadA [Planctomycetia bacterium]|nr:Flp pilus assembly complex ATPase component TadA [Planctomycetia bacterium]MCC7316151.1 Flp pilus assembly complex ATPase component TadA [Planctomycetota bacterium]OQZ03892.1 MAG: ATPase [Planctomycetes bacterium UTPLA1]
MQSTLAKAGKKQLGQILLKKGLLTEEQLERAIEEQQSSRNKKLLGEVIIELGLAGEDQVVEALAEAYNVPYAKLTPRLVDPRVIDLIPREFLEKHGILPLFLVQGVLTVAMSEPANVFLLEEIGRITTHTVQVVAVSGADIQAILAQYVKSANVFVIDDIIEDVSADTFELIETKVDDITSLEGMAGDSPVIKLVNFLIYSAVKEGASDIHIEPDETCLRIRNRVDGVLYEKLNPPAQMMAPVVSRIKIMAGLDIAERRLPQDGGIHVMMEGRPIDLRVSTLPNMQGEKVVIRIIDNSKILVNMETLGFSIDLLKAFRTQLLHPHGLVLVTGPTGSGKSTTLYAALMEINSPERNVCTVEDPIEYNLRRINQFQVNEKIGLKFATVLRALLRQDPDVIMVGEIRDDDTARTAVQAALTGHMVLSTLHTNDAVSAITRLHNIGVEGYLIAAALEAVLAQRLVRKICPSCKEPQEPTPNTRHAMQKLGYDVESLMVGKGCAKCHGTGYSGRVGIHELFIPDDALRQAISDGAPLQELRKVALSAKMCTLYEDGMLKAKAGITTVEEVFRVCAA